MAQTLCKDVNNDLETWKLKLTNASTSLQAGITHWIFNDTFNKNNHGNNTYCGHGKIQNKNILQKFM
ncbi:hypothetical protein RhiirA1_454753 [Rhizophagus irregularis]|uniref:Uncharacterized protein n=1 Tax=Rhizophagus irregularis TaxID=588596 RepID=A0A2N0S4H5_9GLOM|nr:hypothetical protein RhiirA1_454753 [Rhizophagus irregularis]